MIRIFPLYAALTEGTILFLNLFSPNDALELFQLIDRNRNYLKQWLPWLDLNTNEADSLAFIIKSLRECAKRKSLVLGIWHEDKIVGIISLKEIDNKKKTAYIGYWLGQSYQGKGFITGSLKELIKFSFSILGLKRLYISCAVGNLKSRKIPQKLNFTLSKLIKKKEFLYDHYVDHYIYVLEK